MSIKSLDEAAAATCSRCGNPLFSPESIAAAKPYETNGYNNQVYVTPVRLWYYLCYKTRRPVCKCCIATGDIATGYIMGRGYSSHGI